MNRWIFHAIEVVYTASVVSAAGYYLVQQLSQQ